MVPRSSPYDVMMSLKLQVLQNSFVDVGPCVIRVGMEKDAETESKEPESWCEAFQRPEAAQLPRRGSRVKKQRTHVAAIEEKKDQCGYGTIN